MSTRIILMPICSWECFMLHKKNKLAVDYFNNALNIKPDNIDVSYYLAMYYQETGSYDEAIKII